MLHVSEKVLGINGPKLPSVHVVLEESWLDAEITRKRNVTKGGYLCFKNNVTKGLLLKRHMLKKSLKKR